MAARATGFALSWVILLALACCIAWAVPAHAADAPLLIARSELQRCTAEGIVAMSAARNAVLFKGTRQKELAAANMVEVRKQIINEVFDDYEAKGGSDYAAYGVRRFYHCARREQLPITMDAPQAASCFLRDDLVFTSFVLRSEGITAAKALDAVKKASGTGTPTNLPDALLERVVTMVYANPQANDPNISRGVIQSCLFPQDWAAWSQAQQARPPQPPASTDSSADNGRFLVLTPQGVDPAADTAGLNDLVRRVTQSFSARLADRLKALGRTPVNVLDQGTQYSQGQKLALHVAKEKAPLMAMLTLETSTVDGDTRLSLRVQGLKVRVVSEGASSGSVQPTAKVERIYVLRSSKSGDNPKNMTDLANDFVSLLQTEGWL